MPALHQLSPQRVSGAENEIHRDRQAADGEPESAAGLSPAGRARGQSGALREGQGKFWEFRDRLLAAQGALPPEAVRKLAQESGLDVAALETCTAGAESAAALEQEMAEAKAAGIVASPTFVLGKVSGDKVTGVKLVGAQSLPRLEMEMRKLLNEGK